MTQMLDPYELNAPDEIEVDNDFPLGVSCAINDEECEACQ